MRANITTMEVISGAEIMLAPLGEQAPGTQERLVTIRGTNQQVRKPNRFKPTNPNKFNPHQFNPPPNVNRHAEQVSEGAGAVLENLYEDPECQV